MKIFNWIVGEFKWIFKIGWDRVDKKSYTKSYRGAMHGVIVVTAYRNRSTKELRKSVSAGVFY